MRILITGSKGFIGKQVESRLLAAGFQTEGFDIVDGDDIRNFDSLLQKAEGCHVIIHLAAVEGQSPTRTMETNLQGTWNMLCAGKETHVEKIIFLSSVDALGVFQGEAIPRYLPLDDDYPCHPKTPYSISKKLGEDMCRMFSDSTGIPTISLRPPGVWDETSYQKITTTRKSRPEYEWNPYWEYGAFIDIRDLTEAILLSIQNRFTRSHCLLLASDDITTSGLSSLELVHKLHPQVPWHGGMEYHVDPCKSLVNTDNAKTVLNWSPKYSWRKFIEESKANL